MKRSSLLMLFAAAIMATLCMSFPATAQQPSANPPASRGLAVEVTYFKGRGMAYQRVGEWTWYEMFRRPPSWKPRDGEVPVAAIKITPRQEDGVIKARVTVLRGRNHETEDFVADYTLSTEKKIAVQELAALGVEPFELQLVRAPATVADPPVVVNKTKSLTVSVEPIQSTLPSFSARILNNSSKTVATFGYHTSIDGVRKLSGAPQNETGEPIIKPGETFRRAFRYPMNLSPVSTGEVPPALPNLVFSVTSVVFTDGTYEGDASAAANFFAVKLGEKAQLKSFVDMLRAKDYTNSEAAVEAAMGAVNEDAIIAEILLKIPTLTPEDKTRLREVVQFGKSRAVKLFRGASGEPAAALAERLQKRIDALP